MRIFICTQKEFGRDVIRRLLDDGHEIVGMAPPPQVRLKDKAFGLAKMCGIPIVSDCDRLVSSDIPDDTDLVITAFSYWMVSKKILEKTTYGGIGYHPSLLPRHRGRSAIRWTYEMGDPVTGGTVYWLSDRCDGGDVLLQRVLFVDRHLDDYRKLWDDLAPMGVDMISDAVKMIASGTAPRVPQDERFATWEPNWYHTAIKRNEVPLLPPPSV